MEWPRKGAKGAKQSCWQKDSPVRNDPDPNHLQLGSFVFFAPFRGSTSEFGINPVTGVRRKHGWLRSYPFFSGSIRGCSAAGCFQT